MKLGKEFVPTRLYIKQHRTTGLKYFGKTINPNIEKYKGSGKRWTNHLRVHGRKDVVNLWVSDWFHDEKEIKEFALAFSEIFDIVNSDEWANLKEETGHEGGGFKAGSVRAIEAGKKLSKIKSDPLWKETIGKEARKRAGITLSNTVNDPKWKNTVGREKNRRGGINQSKTKNTAEWKNTAGVISGKKQSETKASMEYKESKYKTCDRCAKRMDPGNYTRYHGINCKN